MEENIFVSKDPMNRLRMLIDVLPKSVQADQVLIQADNSLNYLVIVSVMCIFTISLLLNLKCSEVQKCKNVHILQRFRSLCIDNF